jgi:DNA repair protein RadA/Sms
LKSPVRRAFLFSASYLRSNPAMAKATTLYVCAECGGQTSKWQGQCPHCLAWNTLSESWPRCKPRRFQAWPPAARWCGCPGAGIETPRMATGLPEFDRVLGGGLVGGGVVLIGGDPGIGKSTLLLQALAEISARAKTLYVSGEESAAQIAMRANRLGLMAPISPADRNPPGSHPRHAARRKSPRWR